MKLTNSNCDEIKNSNCDETENNSNYDEIQKLKLG